MYDGEFEQFLTKLNNKISEKKLCKIELYFILLVAHYLILKFCIFLYLSRMVDRR